MTGYIQNFLKKLIGSTAFDEVGGVTQYWYERQSGMFFHPVKGSLFFATLEVDVTDAGERTAEFRMTYMQNPFSYKDWLERCKILIGELGLREANLQIDGIPGKLPMVLLYRHADAIGRTNEGRTGFDATVPTSSFEEMIFHALAQEGKMLGGKFYLQNSSTHPNIYLLGFAPGAFRLEVMGTNDRLISLYALAMDKVFQG